MNPMTLRRHPTQLRSTQHPGIQDPLENSGTHCRRAAQLEEPGGDEDCWSTSVKTDVISVA